MRYIRLDDFPQGHREWWSGRHHREVVGEALPIFEEAGVPYILGASPLLMTPADIDFLNREVKTGHVVMHGFRHYFDYADSNWESVEGTWPRGGEFEGQSVDALAEPFRECLQICSSLERFTQEHFIPPFNVYTQELLDALHVAMPSCRYIHTCDKEWNNFRQEELVYHGIDPVIATLGHSYDHAALVADRLEKGPVPDQITLHWICDIRQYPYTWKDHYRRLCGLIRAGDSGC